jgi:NADPH2:quinone reductase
MQAAFLVRKGDPGQAFEIRSLPDPEPAAGEVSIEVAAFGLNFADVLARLGLYPDAPPRPCVLGYEVAGTVSAVGSQVTDLREGDRVCAFTRFGGYATRAVTSALGVLRIPAKMDLVTAAALPVQLGTAWYCAEEMVQPREEDHVLVQAAAGGVGGALVQLAKARGCTVYGTAGGPEKIEHLRQLGVDHPIDYREHDFADAIRALRGASGLDVVFDSLGGKAFRQAFDLLAPGGRIISLGVASMAGARASLLRSLGVVLGFGRRSPLQLLASSRSIIGVNMLQVADHRPATLRRCLRGVLDAVATGRLTARLDRSFPIAELAAAHEHLGLRRSAGKVVVTW